MPPATAASNARATRLLPRQAGQLGAPRREEGLVGGDDALSRPERRNEERTCRIQPADQLDDDVDVGSDGDGEEVLGNPGTGGQALREPAREGATRDRDELQVDAELPGESRGLGFDEADERLADGTEAEQAQPQGRGHGAFGTHDSW